MPEVGLLIMSEDGGEPGLDALVRENPRTVLLELEEVETIAGRGWIVTRVVP